MHFSEIIRNWKTFERFIEGLYRDVDEVQVRHDVRLVDNDGAPRQVDVLVVLRRGPHEFIVIIECKYLNKRVERGDIDKLLKTVEKTNAAKGVIFTTVGYQSGALTTAAKNGVDAFLIRDPLDEEWQPSVPQQTHLQLCTCRLENKLHVPTDALEIGTRDVWPRGIKVAPAVAFGRDRSSTPILNRQDRKTLEDLLEEETRRCLERVVAPIQVIGDGRDCVGHFTTRCNLKFVHPIVVQERPSPFVVLRIAALSVNVAVRIEQRRFRSMNSSELDACAIAENCVSNARFQVSRATPDAPFVWMDVLQRPVVEQIPDNSRLIVVSNESFHAECFRDPWATFDRVAVYEIDEVPPSRTLPRILAALARPAG